MAPRDKKDPSAKRLGTFQSKPKSSSIWGQDDMFEGMYPGGAVAKGASQLAQLLKSPEGKKAIAKAAKEVVKASEKIARKAAKEAEKAAKEVVQKVKGPKPSKSPTGLTKAERHKKQYDLAVKNDWNTAIRRKYDAIAKDARTVVSGGLSRAARKEANQKASIAKADAGGYKTRLTEKRDAGTLPWQNKPAVAPIKTSRPKPKVSKGRPQPAPKPKPKAKKPDNPMRGPGNTFPVKKVSEDMKKWVPGKGKPRPKW